MKTEFSAPLSELAVDWIDEWICLESADNREALRDAGYRWRPVPPEDDNMPTGLMEVILPETEIRKKWDLYKDMLATPGDPWSDYMDPRELPDDVEGVPYWIHRRVQKYHEWEEKSAAGKTRKPAPHLPTRCTATKRDGTRCWSWCADKDSEGICRAHAPAVFRANDMGHQIMLAKIKMNQAAPAMADVLEELALGAVSEQVRLKAAETILDRVGVSASSEININGNLEVQHSAADAVKERLAVMVKRMKPEEIEAAEEDSSSSSTVTGEIVEEKEPVR